MYDASLMLAFQQVGRVGGAARARKLSPERRTAIARKAAKARWKRHKARQKALVEAGRRAEALARADAPEPSEAA